MSTIEVTTDAYIVHYHSPEGRRSYGCADLPSLQHLIMRLTGREWSTFALDERGLPSMPTSMNQHGFVIGHPFHIYSEV